MIGNEELDQLASAGPCKSQEERERRRKIMFVHLTTLLEGVCKALDLGNPVPILLYDDGEKFQVQRYLKNATDDQLVWWLMTDFVQNDESTFNMVHDLTMSHYKAMADAKKKEVC